MFAGKVFIKLSIFRCDEKTMGFKWSIIISLGIKIHEVQTDQWFPWILFSVWKGAEGRVGEWGGALAQGLETFPSTNLALVGFSDLASYLD